jgi:glycosyltransferase involved in cell wall biosynthesis
MRQRNIANGRIPASKCTVVQNGIQPVICDSKKNNGLRESLGVKSSSLLIVTTGRAHPYKRFDLIIQSANLLLKQEPNLDIVFLLIGDGPAMSNLQEMVSQLGIENSVRLLGFRSDVRDLLCISDIALHAALGEGFSLSIIEYMSAGLPVLVPDIPSVSQAITHDLTGLIYSKDNADDIASYIRMLAQDIDKRQAMSNAAKQEANTRYSLEACTNRFIHIIESEY